MHEEPRAGPRHAPGGQPGGQFGNRGGGGTRRQDDEDHRANIRQVFGTTYVSVILEPHRNGYNTFIERVKQFVQSRASHITTHQLRNIFTRVRAAKEPAHLAVLRPQLAYVAGRSEGAAMRELIVLLDDLIKAVETPEQVAAFRDFFEAVIAYHRYYNPKGG